MYKFPITQYSHFAELPLDELNRLKFPVYILDFNWNYLFINKAVEEHLGHRAENLIGRNMWESFPELGVDPAYKALKKNIEKGVVPRIETVSPVTAKRLSITGYALNDCYYFAASVLPDKKNLIDELRNELIRKKTRPSGGK